MLYLLLNRYLIHKWLWLRSRIHNPFILSLLIFQILLQILSNFHLASHSLLLIIHILVYSLQNPFSNFPNYLRRVLPNQITIFRPIERILDGEYILYSNHSINNSSGRSLLIFRHPKSTILKLKHRIYLAYHHW